MVDSGLVRRSAAEAGGLPGVEVAVEVDDRNLAVRTVDGSQERKNDSVVATKRNDTRVVLAIGGRGTRGWPLSVSLPSGEKVVR